MTALPPANQSPATASPTLVFQGLRQRPILAIRSLDSTKSTIGISCLVSLSLGGIELDHESIHPYLHAQVDAWGNQFLRRGLPDQAQDGRPITVTGG
jgi:hypothetical protein